MIPSYEVKQQIVNRKLKLGKAGNATETELKINNEICSMFK